jgi:hypothetical protein
MEISLDLPDGFPLDGGQGARGADSGGVGEELEPEKQQSRLLGLGRYEAFKEGVDVAVLEVLAQLDMAGIGQSMGGGGERPATEP